MLTTLPGATNDLILPCHEQRAGAATAPDPVVVRGFLPPAITASRLRRLQLPRRARSGRYPSFSTAIPPLCPPNLQALATPLVFCQGLVTYFLFIFVLAPILLWFILICHIVALYGPPIILHA